MIVELALGFAVVTSRPSITPRVSSPRISSSSPKSTARSTAKSTPSKPSTPEGRLSSSYRNTSGQEVTYRNTGMNWFTTYMMFGWLWHSPDKDKCFDKNNKQIDCKKN